MRVARSHTTLQFEKDFLALPKTVKKKAKRKIQFFESDTTYRGLRVHKLKGILARFWAFSIDGDYRVIFRFLPNQEAIYYRIGPHDIYGEIERLF